MKWKVKAIVLAVLAMVLAGLLYTQVTLTTNLSLRKPAASSSNWDVPLNANMDDIDSFFTGGKAIPNGAFEMTERAAPTGVLANDWLYGDSTGHCLMAINNGSLGSIGCLAGLGKAQTFTTLQTFAAGGAAVGDVKVGRIVTGAVATPSCAFTTGGGTGPTCSFLAGANDSSGTIFLVTGTGSPAALGTITLTFSSAYGGDAAVCVYTLNNRGAGQWNARATVIDKTSNTTTDLFAWDNNAVALTASTAYYINFHCYGQA